MEIKAISPMMASNQVVHHRAVGTLRLQIHNLNKFIEAQAKVIVELRQTIKVQKLNSTVLCINCLKEIK